MIPVLGFLVTGIVITMMLALLNRQYLLTQHIVEHDLSTIQRYTSLLSDFSKNHLSVHELLTRHRKDLSLSDVQALGEARVSIIRQIANSLNEQFDAHRLHSEQSTKEAIEALKSSMMLYAQSVVQAVSDGEDQSLQKANQLFAQTHKGFVGLLNRMGQSAENETEAQLKLFEQNILIAALVVASILISLIIFSMRQSGRLSAQLHHMIYAMNQLASGNLKFRRVREHYDSKELRQLSEAIDCFSSTLTSLEQAQERMEEQNILLKAEVQYKECAESELTHALDALQLANDDLESRVAERTSELAHTNEELLAEIEQRSRVEQQLQLFKMAIYNTSEAVIITDNEARIVEVNPAYCQITGYTRSEVLGKSPNITRSDRHSEAFYRDMWHSLTSKGQWSGEIWDRRKSGEVFPKWLTINAVNHQDDDRIWYVGVFMDISDMKAAEQQLEQLAYYDPLTQLPNRVLFQDRLDQEVRTCTSENGRFGVLYIDLDRFKYVNDTLGHSVGDQLLIEVATRIKECLRQPDTIARISGDEFTAIIRSVHEVHDMEVVAEKIIGRIEQPVLIDEREVYVGASIGISLFPDHGNDAESLKKHADMAMYKAKDAGRGGYQVFDFAMSSLNVDRMALTGKLKQAISQSEFVLHYQPIVDIASHSVAAVEALIRWQPEEGDLIYPGDFIEHAEESGLIHDIGNWVLEESCRQGAQWNQQLKYPVAIAVNLSAVQFENEELATYIADVLQRTGLKPELLNVEITETTVMKQPELTEQLLREISALGVGISIDDFGAGYSSLSYLMRFTANKLKIDRAFTQQLTERRTDQIIPTAIINLGRSLNLQTVAEGVETQFQLDMLYDKGCHYAQGYLFSKPLDKEAIWPVLEKHTLLEDVRGMHI